MGKYTEFSNQVLVNVGGKENITSAVHCMTRLRLTLKDRSKVNVEGVKKIKGALGAQFSGEQFQIIIGQNVSNVYPEFCQIAGIAQEGAIDENLDDKEPFSIKKIPSKILDYVSGSIAPILPIMMGAGFFKMFYAIFGASMLNLFPEKSSLMQTLYIVGNAGFYFLPVYVAWSAAKKMKTSTALALMLGTLLIDPNILAIVKAGKPFSIFGLTPIPLVNYSQSLIPILLSVWILKYVYKLVDKIVPTSIKVIGVPFLTLIVMVPLTFSVLAPVGNWIGLGLTFFFSKFYEISGPLSAAVIGAFWPFFVSTGMHAAIIQIALLNLTTLGHDFVIMPGANIANYALMGMVVAYFLRSKGEEKELAGANAITLIVGGISEPTLFGILLRNKKAMITQIIGGGIGGLVGGILGVGFYTQGAANFLTVLQFAGGPGNNFINGCIASAIAFVVALAVGLVIGFSNNENKDNVSELKERLKKQKEKEAKKKELA